MQTDPMVSSLRPGGGGTRGAGVFRPHFDTSTADDLLPHVASLKTGASRFEGHELIRYSRDQPLQLREFNGNQGNRPQASPHITQPANYTFVSEQIRQGGHMLPEMSRNQQFFHNNHLQLQPNLFYPTGPAVYPHDVNETIQREIGKRRIREEMVMSEMIRRREFEADMMREILINRQMAMRQMGGDGFRFGLPHVTGFDSSMRLRFLAHPLDERIAPSVEGRERLVINGVEHVPFQRGGVEPVPFQTGTPALRISEVKPVVEAPVEKKKIILLAKPDENASGSKRKAEPTPIVDTIVLKKKAKEEWRCEVCKLGCTGEQALKDHLKGKKHRSKQAAAITRDWKNYSIGLVSTNATQPVASEHLNNESEEKPGDAKKMHKFWCDICQMGTNAKRVMKNHERGKKHVNRSLKLRNIEVLVNKVDEEPKDNSTAELEDDSNAVFKVDVDGEGVSFENFAEPKDDSNAVVKADENVEELKDDSKTVVKDDEDGKPVSLEDPEEAKDNSNAAVEAKDDQITTA